MEIGDKIPEKARSYLYFFLIGLLIIGVVVIAQREWGSTGLESANIAVTGFLTAALVWLYKEQAETLDAQRKLLTQELNREAREKHTEALREVVQIWHGQTDRGVFDNPTKTSGNNLPSVGKTSIESAPTGESWAIYDNETFQVIPHFLEGDRYLNDLLENHATDLLKKKNNIEQLYDCLVALREEFHQKGLDVAVLKREEYRLEASENLIRWVFDILVMYERGRWEDEEEMLKYVRDKRFEKPIQNRDEAQLLLVKAEIPSTGSTSPIFTVQFEDDSINLPDYRKYVEEDAHRVANQILTDVSTDDCPFLASRNAARILDTAEEEISELESLLIEYNGKPIFTGDCKYMEEARIENA